MGLALKLISILIYVLLTLSSGVLLIFVNISAISTDLVPSALKFISVDTSSLGQQLSIQNGELDVSTLYANDSEAALGQSLGVRQEYYFGQYSYCGTIEDRRDGVCELARDADSHFISRLDPYTYIIEDTPENLKDAVRQHLEASQSTFTSSDYLREYSAAGYWLIFLSAIFTGVALFAGLIPIRYTISFAGVFCLLAFLTVTVGSSILTAVIVKMRDVNGDALGVTVHYGVSLWLVWITTFVLLCAVPFYFVASN
ncbi:hypothetical protein E3P92_00623 [Wallemia ichthyophaga]|uniref:SUR7 family protein pun1 n=1 Tax=Wallemia ichthyophaga TaxID=245174 RepID=A0A4V4M7A6_WALIC|nr:hypothetical protein E3P95_03957 [Wallemia ichthyophaga]TIB04504.1 hypothetical protein E3P94_00569 [Wallemia ichthyophaga]TIB16736.1 hypothetical protein E3P90_00380 [Wallemia ichthyophaga]TIB18369.1 hypothetical protein E3P93_00237 [Wallemia ichthyophaga]TIB18477.1 hypothetical protein E3P92_00623 [Wallemia ichthyophaga]